MTIKPEGWAELADAVCALNPGDDPASIMIRASFQYSKALEMVGPTPEAMSVAVRGDIAVMMAALERYGYRIVRAAAITPQEQGGG